MALKSGDITSSAYSFWQRNAFSLKGVVIFILMLILMIPAAMVGELIREREMRHEEAISEVSGKWGESQTLTGPVWVVPYETIVKSKEGETKQINHACFLPDDLRVNGKVSPEMRRRGIYEVVLYSADVTLEGQFPLPNIQQLIPADAQILWDKSALILGISDLRGLREQVSLQWNGQPRFFEPGIGVEGILANSNSAYSNDNAGSQASGINVLLPLSGPPSGSQSFKITLSAKGSHSLFFTPVGKVTTVHLNAPWADPGFTGAFLPDNKKIDASGFEADWKVLNLNRNYPQQWISENPASLQSSAFGVDFLMPVDNYQKATRSVKYAILFIGLTFLAVFFIEMRQSKRVHPFQYALIGLALVIFYTLLISISEHLPYNTAYLIAAAMTTGLTAWYTSTLFDSKRIGLFTGGTLALLYTFLFVVLQQQDHALLIGSIGLFFILAVVMYFSKKIQEETT